MSLTQPTIIRRSPVREVWKFRDHHYEAFIFTDGTVQLRACDEGGNVIDQIPVTGHGKIDRKQAINWLNSHAK